MEQGQGSTITAFAFNNIKSLRTVPTVIISIWPLTQRCGESSAEDYIFPAKCEQQQISNLLEYSQVTSNLLIDCN